MLSALRSKSKKTLKQRLNFGVNVKVKHVLKGSAGPGLKSTHY